MAFSALEAGERRKGNFLGPSLALMGASLGGFLEFCSRVA